nr:hypothetical protein Iba_scaffold33602CG0010 [Ipomoea batatas]GME02086.1 hypothetical protein Iba_scaffold636473CG0010 [Ipomoea batatas]GME04233.1 hypothetical protein Iba_scaffold1711CG0010 [Ipomoea batatas]GME20448.1 hypothetical protein Iba_scaffold25148CG0140 [Ipomoea batatas]
MSASPSPISTILFRPSRAKEFKCTRSVNQMGRLSRHSSLIQTEMDWKLAVSIQSHEPGHYIRCSNIRRPGIMLSLKSEL